MDMTIYPGKLSGHLNAPSSGPILARMLLLSALCDAPMTFFADAVTRQAQIVSDNLSALGCAHSRRGIRISAGPLPLGDLPRNAELDASDDTDALGLLLPLCCALKNGARLCGVSDRAAWTPVLRELARHGAACAWDGAALKVGGGLKTGRYVLTGLFAEQAACGLMAVLPMTNGISLIDLPEVRAASERSDLTVRVLARYGVRVSRTPGGYAVAGRQRCAAFGACGIEGDWLSASPWLALSATGGGVSVGNLTADTAQKAGVMPTLLAGLGGDVDASRCPALLPALMMGASLHKGRTRFCGLPAGSKTVEALCTAFGALGCAFERRDGVLTAEGDARVRGGAVSCAGMSRLAAALAVLSAHADAPVTLADCGPVARVCPDFFRHFEALGGRLDLSEDADARPA